MLNYSSGQKLRSNKAEVAQLVEHHLAMVRVAGSNPVFRSSRGATTGIASGSIGGMAEW